MIFIISFNWVDLMISLINSSCIRVSDWTLSNHLDLSFISEFILVLVLMKKTFIQFSLAYFYYMLQIYSDVSLTLFRTCDSDFSHSF